MNWYKRVLSRLGIETRGIQNWQSWIASPTLSGVTVTPETAVTVPAVLSSTLRIAENVGVLPFLVYKRLPTGGRTPDPSHIVYDLIEVEPNPEMSADTFWQTYMTHVLLWGGGFAEICRDEWTGDPEGLYLLDPATTCAKRDNFGRLYYESTGNFDGTTKKTKFLPENVLHVPGLSFNGVMGSSVIDLARGLIGEAMAAETTSEAAFGNGGTPGGYLKKAGKANDQEMKNLRESWNMKHGGPFNAGRVAILEQGWEFSPLSANFTQMQFVELRKHVRTEVSSMFGVPPHLIGELQDANFATIEEQNIQFFDGTIRIWCEKIASEVNRKMFTRRQRSKWFAEHNLQARLRGNAASQAAWIQGLFGRGSVDVDGAAMLAGINPVGGELGKSRYVASGYQLLTDPTPTDPTDPVDLPPSGGKAEDPAPPDASTEADPAPLDGNAPQTAVNAVRRVLVADMGRMVRKEANAIRRAARGTRFKDAVADFYATHGATLREAVGPSVEAFAAVTGQPLDVDAVVTQAVEASRVEVTGLADDPDGIDDLLTRWENLKAELFADGLAKGDA